MYLYIYIYIHISYVYTYTYIYIYIYIYTYIYRYILPWQRLAKVYTSKICALDQCVYLGGPRGACQL